MKWGDSYMKEGDQIIRQGSTYVAVQGNGDPKDCLLCALSTICRPPNPFCNDSKFYFLLYSGDSLDDIDENVSQVQVTQLNQSNTFTNHNNNYGNGYISTSTTTEPYKINYVKHGYKKH